MRNNRDLGIWLLRQIWGEDAPPCSRKPPKRASALHSKPARNPRYRAWVKSLPSAVSGVAPPCDACHTGPHAFGQKASDYTCIPLTRAEHDELHAVGQEEFGRRYGLNIKTLVRRLNRAWFVGRRAEGGQYDADVA